jgi:hypothetical protein
MQICFSMKNRILFQAYGNEGIVAECKFALLQLAAAYNRENSLPEVIIYTDKVQDFSLFATALPLHFIEMNGDQIAAWKGKNQFVHRVKVEIIQNALQRFGGKLLYADTDTFCLQKSDALFDSINASQVIMHEKEGLLSQPANLHFKKWKHFLQKNDFSDIGQLPAINTIMWNAGIIGLQEDHFPLLQKILALTDTLYASFPRHTVEQFAFCYTFQNTGLQILSAQPYFFNYLN